MSSRIFVLTVKAHVEEAIAAKLNAPRSFLDLSSMVPAFLILVDEKKTTA